MTRSFGLMRRRRFILGAAAAAPLIRKARAAETIVLKLAHPDTTTHPVQKVALQFAKLVKDRTGGAIDIRIFPNGQLGTEINIVSGSRPASSISPFIPPDTSGRCFRRRNWSTSRSYSRTPGSPSVFLLVRLARAL